MTNFINQDELQFVLNLNGFISKNYLWVLIQNNYVHKLRDHKNFMYVFFQQFASHSLFPQLRDLWTTMKLHTITIKLNRKKKNVVTRYIIQFDLNINKDVGFVLE